MKGDALVSVIVPIYKIRAEYLQECIESLLRQTYNHYELILVDDGSPDQCGAICDQYAMRDTRIAVIHQRNAGVSAARNAGLNRAEGEYIVFVDPDDYLDDMFLERMLARLPEDAQIISCCAIVEGEDFSEEDHFYQGERYFADDAQEEQDQNGVRTYPKEDLYLQLMRPQHGQPQTPYTAIGVPWGKVYRADFLKECGLSFDTALPRMQDNLFNMYAFHAARKVFYLDQPLYHYRYEHLQQYSAGNHRRYVDVFFAVSAARRSCMEQTGLMEDAELRTTYYEEQLALLLMISYTGIYHSTNGYDAATRKRMFLELADRPLYNDLMHDYRPPTLKRRLFLFMVRHRCAALMDLAMRLREYKETITTARSARAAARPSSSGGGNACIEIIGTVIIAMPFRERRACA